MKSVVLMDVSHIGYAAAANKHRLSAGELDTTAIFGTIQTIRKVAADFAGPVTALFDGRSWRHAECAIYKDGRAVTPEQIALRECWKASKTYIARLLRPLGVNMLFANNLEADDLAARLRRRYADAGTTVTLVSGDKDWLQLIEERVSVFNTVKDLRINLGNFQEVTGLTHPRAIAERKALMGKPLEMPGVGGIGEKTAVAILNEFSSVEGFLNAMIINGEDYKRANRRARKLVDEPEKLAQFRTNMRLAWLDHPGLPPSVGTRLVKGSYDPAAFHDLCGELAFHSIIRAGASWLEPFRNRN